METTLACVVRSTVEHMGASEAALDVAAMALDPRPARPYRHLRHWIAAFTAAATADRAVSPRVAVEHVLALAALAHAETGDLRAARALAERALARVPAGGTTPPRTLEVLAWTGDGERASALAGDRLFERAEVASGLARGGDLAGARTLLAALASEAITADHAVRGAIVMAQVWTGELAAARTLIDAERDPDRRALLYAWAAYVAAQTTHAGRAGFVDDAIAAVRADAETAPAGLALAKVAWVDLVKARDLIDRDRTARARLHAWLLDPGRVAEHLDLVGANVVRAEVAGMAADADRLLAALPAAHRTRAELDLAVLRGRFDHVFALLERHRRERDVTRSQDAVLDPRIVAGIDAVEVDLWLAFTDAPRSPGQIEAFQRLVCR